MKAIKIFTIVLALMIFVLPLSAFASAETLPSGYSGNCTNLITVRNPAASSSSTANKVCVISAVAVPGTTVTLYSYDSSRSQYVKMYSDGRALEATVGAAGLYAQSVSLKSGKNIILVVASSGSNVETAKLDITMVKNEAADSILNIWQALIN